MMQFEELLCTLRRDYPDLVFKSGRKFSFRFPRTIVFEQNLVQREGMGQKIVQSTVTSQNTARLATGSQEIIQLPIPPEQEKDDLQIPSEPKNCRGNSGVEQKFLQDNNCLQLLHEVGHARLKHRDFGVDLERVKMERAAWTEARRLCGVYNIYYDEDFVEEELDTYREWLHRQSCCKNCGLTCYQTEDGIYHCPRCEDLLGG